MKFIKEIGRNPHLDWLLILVISFAVFVALAIGGYNLYNAVTSGDIQGNGSTATGARLNEKAITSVISQFETREEVSGSVRNGYAGVSDPSK